MNIFKIKFCVDRKLFKMTKQILFSVFSLLFIFISNSKAMERQDKDFKSNDQLPREADAVRAVLSETEEVASSRLTRAADVNTSKSKKKFRKSKKNKSTKKVKASKKKRKSKRNNKKASKKGKKSKRKNKKANKMNKKSKKNKKANKKEKKSKNKKARKNKKAIKEEKKSRKKNRQGKSTVTATCANTVKDILNNGKRKASNFDRQKKRIEARLPKISNKLEKASEYNQTMDYLIAANASGCPAGDQILLDALVATLGECKMNIETACAVPMLNQTQIDECTPIVEGFLAEEEKCLLFNFDEAAACECWESPTMAELLKGVKDCVIKPSEANVTDVFKACKGAVSTCNKAKINAIPVLVNCSKSKADLKAKAETVANNIAALDSAKTAVEAVANSTRAGAGRAAATDCAGFSALVKARKFSN